MAVSGIKDSLKQQGVRLTRQRKILLDLIDQSGQHLDAERLFTLAREKDPQAEPRDGLPDAEAAEGRRPGGRAGPDAS